MRPSDALLRTFAAVPPACRVLDAGCGEGRHLLPLSLLGFEAVGIERTADAAQAARQAVPGATVIVQEAGALPFPEGHFGWVVAFRLLPGLEAPGNADVLRELYRVLAPGGWIYVAVETEAVPAGLTALMERAGFVLAEAPVAEFDADEARIVRGIYRRVEPGVMG